MRYRITFAKTEAMRFTSHLDTHRAWERAVRRAQLPLAYSHGYNPRPKINLASALPLGFTSSNELVEIWLERELSPEEVETHLKRAETPGLQIIKVEVVDHKAPKLPNLVQSAEYIVTLTRNFKDLKERIEKILEADRLVRERRGKEYDLRPLISEILELPPRNQDDQRLRFLLAARTGATGRPDEVLAEMGIPLNNARVHRSKLILKMEN
jgi:radical SAM-linked protein